MPCRARRRNKGDTQGFRDDAEVGGDREERCHQDRGWPNGDHRASVNRLLDPNTPWSTSRPWRERPGYSVEGSIYSLHDEGPRGAALLHTCTLWGRTLAGHILRRRCRTFTVAGAGALGAFVFILRFIFHEIVARVKDERGRIIFEPVEVAILMADFAITLEIPIRLFLGRGFRIQRS